MFACPRPARSLAVQMVLSAARDTPTGQEHEAQAGVKRQDVGSGEGHDQSLCDGGGADFTNVPETG